MALVAVGIMPFLLVATEVFRRYAGEAFRETQRRYAAIHAFLQEQLSGMGLVQVNGQEVRSRQQFRVLNEDYLEAFLRTIFAYAVFFPVVEFITSATTGRAHLLCRASSSRPAPSPGPAAGLHPAVRALLPAHP
jgi:ATP-binding cassette subfamily B multidrug efflux pump